jgi:hypothetical protein
MKGREPRKGKRGTARLTWESKPKKALLPKEITLEPNELVIPNPSHRTEPPAPLLKDKRSTNRFIWGDNLPAMEALLKEGYGGTVELIYIDPPFGSKADYSHRLKVEGVEIERRAYTDNWAGGSRHAATEAKAHEKAPYREWEDIRPL